ncbi:hypothetical protein [Cecembia calidifontis]|uniref:Uncharacterized protein n=1 Tax=Cecembia calidifontis TaxID=1187080 RepID=A0A4Q7P725_9BACT|nr:hypothetical protein [Cecembia calidifontis]RZS95913.1 hypothetical protein BC751_1466 [Cecembia calidifontis]
MNKDLITQTLKTYFIEKGKDLKVIQRYLSIKHKLILDEKLLLKRLNSIN